MKIFSFINDIFHHLQVSAKAEYALAKEKWREKKKKQHKLQKRYQCVVYGTTT